MARNVIKVNLDLDRIHCFDEGDGWGDAEPYLWTVFFKIDGDTVQLTNSLTLSGPPTIQTTPGSHGNLGVAEVDAGDNVAIPSAIGEWETFLKPIPAPASLSSLIQDLGGVVGVVVILMEEDNVSDAGAEAGHQALNAAVRSALQQIINTRSLSNQDVSDSDIDGFTSAIESKVKDAIESQQSFFENLWSWLNPDDTIGVKVFVFKHDDLDPAISENFSQRWKNEGDWEIFGNITSAPLCPVNALNGLFDPKGGSAGSAGAKKRAGEVRETGHGTPLDVEPMRAFRDGDYRKLPGLAAWFALAERHAGRVARMVLLQPDLLASVRKVLEWGNLIAQQPDVPMSKEHAAHAERLLAALARHRNRDARSDAARALSMLKALKGKTHREAMQFVASVAPARHPNVAGNPSVRVQLRRRVETALDDDSTN